MVPYLFIGDLQNTILSAIMVFSDQVIYPSYVRMPRLLGLSAQADQAAAGAIMWVLGGFAYLVPAAVIAIRCLSPRFWHRNVTPVRACPRSTVATGGLVRSYFALQAGLQLPRLRGRAADMPRFVLAFLATGLCLSLLIATSSNDDDQALWLWRESGPFNIAVFAPSVLQAGPGTFGFLVEDRNTREALLDWTMELSARLVNSEGGSMSEVRAIHKESRNKLLQTAELDLPTSGDWMLNVALKRNSENAGFCLPFRVGKRQRRHDLWPYLVFPGFGMLLFGSYLWRHRSDRHEYKGQGSLR